MLLSALLCLLRLLLLVLVLLVVVGVVVSLLTPVLVVLCVLCLILFVLLVLLGDVAVATIVVAAVGVWKHHAHPGTHHCSVRSLLCSFIITYCASPSVFLSYIPSF